MEMMQKQELLARIEVQLRKAVSPLSDRFRYKDLMMDTASHAVTVGEQPVLLTKTEYAILKLLLQNAEQVIAKSVILDRISEDTMDCTETSLKTHMSHLRSKLREAEIISKLYGELDSCLRRSRIPINLNHFSTIFLTAFLTFA